MQLKSGTILNARYEILEQVGEGGFGTIYHARDLQLNREVALKIPKFSYHDSEKELLRFKREAKLLAQLLHANIMRVYSIDVQDDGTPLIVMEYLEGKSLKQKLNELGTGGALGSETARPTGLDHELCLQIFRQICSGLAYAHKAGLAHRDLSPANVFLVSEAESLTAKLIDFGLARLFEKKLQSSKDTATLTRTGALVGNLSYMSPEACRGEKTDNLSDIYGLGCVLYEMLAGHPPFECWNPIGLLQLHQNEYPPEPEIKWGEAELENRFKNIALKCMQKDRSKRFQSIDEILLLIEQRSDDAAFITPTFERMEQWSNVSDKSSVSNLLKKKAAPTAAIAAITVLTIGALLASKIQHDSEIHRALANMNNEQGAVENRHVKSAREKTARAERIYNIVSRKSRLNKLECATEYFNRLIELATAQRDVKDFKGSEESLRKALKLCPDVAISSDYPKAIVLCDIAYSRIGSADYAGAGEILDEALRFNLVNGITRSNLFFARIKLDICLHNFARAFDDTKLMLQSLSTIEGSTQREQPYLRFTKTKYYPLKVERILILCISIDSQTLSSTKEQLSALMFLDQLAEILLEGNFDTCEKPLKQALALLQKIPPNTPGFQPIARKTYQLWAQYELSINDTKAAAKFKRKADSYSSNASN